MAFRADLGAGFRLGWHGDPPMFLRWQKDWLRGVALSTGRKFAVNDPSTGPANYAREQEPIGGLFFKMSEASSRKCTCKNREPKPSEDRQYYWRKTPANGVLAGIRWLMDGVGSNVTPYKDYPGQQVRDH
jgi:hypothetical protein